MKKKVIVLIRREREYYLTREPNVLTWKMWYFRKLQERVKAWNFFFRMPWADFKTRLAEIAYPTILKNNMDALYLWSDWEAFQKMDKNTWIVPIDEDDWMFPNLVETIREEENHPVYWWKSRWISFSGKTETQKRSIDGHIPSCSYALQLPCKTNLIKNHNDIQKEFPFPTIHFMDKVLSVQVKSIGAISSLVQYSESMEQVLGYVRKRVFLAPNEELKGFLPEIKKYNEVLAELYDSCKI